MDRDFAEESAIRLVFNGKKKRRSLRGTVGIL